MECIPSQLLQNLCIADLQAVEAWWTGLAEFDRGEVAALWDERLDLSLFGVAHEGAEPAVIGGRFVPRDDAAGWTEWRAEYFDHLISNPELVVLDQAMLRTFHICTAHRAARDVLAAGRIPADFRCPLGSPACPMRVLLSTMPDLSQPIGGPRGE